MLIVTIQNLVPAEPGETIVQIWKTGSERHGDIVPCRSWRFFNAR